MELPMVSVTAMALHYDPSGAQWKELGSESGLCTLSILKSSSNEYRYVGQKISNNEIVLNAYIFPEMKYDESTPNFHQWYDKNKNAFGLNFADVNMAKRYAAAIACALEQLNAPQNPPKSATPANERSTFSTTSGNAAKKLPENSSRGNSSKASPYATSQVGSTPAPSVPSAAPKVTAVKASAGAPPPPGPPPSAPAPPGPPPPGPGPAKGPAAPANDFASQLKKAAAQHKETNIEETLNRASPIPQETKPSNPAPAAGGMDFLTEMRMRMQKKPANDAAAAGQSSPAKSNTVKPTPAYATNVNNTQTTITKPSTADPEPSSPTYVTAAALEKFRIDLMNDIIQNMEKMKNEIISSISAKLN